MKVAEVEDPCIKLRTNTIIMNPEPTLYPLNPGFSVKKGFGKIFIQHQQS